MEKVTILKRTVNDIEILLPYGWKKLGHKRKNLNHWDFCLISPDDKKFRSNIEIKRYVENNPSIKCDLSVTNTKWSDSFKTLQISKSELIEESRNSLETSRVNPIVPKLLAKPKNNQNAILKLN